MCIFVIVWISSATPPSPSFLFIPSETHFQFDLHQISIISGWEWNIRKEFLSLHSHGLVSYPCYVVSLVLHHLQRIVRLSTKVRSRVESDSFIWIPTFTLFWFSRLLQRILSSFWTWMFLSLWLLFLFLLPLNLLLLHGRIYWFSASGLESDMVWLGLLFYFRSFVFLRFGWLWFCSIFLLSVLLAICIQIQIKSSLPQNG